MGIFNFRGKRFCLGCQKQFFSRYPSDYCELCDGNISSLPHDTWRESNMGYEEEFDHNTEDYWKIIKEEE